MESRGLAKQLVHISALAVLISTNLAVGASGPPSPPGMSTQAIPSGSFHGVEIPPLWIYDIEAPRDGLHHSGVIVGQDPFTGAGPQEVPTYIVPLVVVVHSMVQTYDPKTGLVTTVPGLWVFDPTAPNPACLSSPNDIPIQLVEQSPLFQNVPLSFGGTNVGSTQYFDAFERASFWRVPGVSVSYHVMLNPAVTLAPIVIDAPANEALWEPAIITGLSSKCAPAGYIDANWLDSYLNGTVLPSLTAQGVSPSSFTLFVFADITPAGSPVTNYNLPFFSYHTTHAQPLLTQMYAVTTFDSEQGTDIEVMTHEIAEAMNDPLGPNKTPPWAFPAGYPFPGCSSSYEVGDPLNGIPTRRIPITMQNGYTYHVQELAFFSWFFGGPSLGVNGWFSNYGTFTSDAGALCP